MKGITIVLFAQQAGGNGEEVAIRLLWYVCCSCVYFQLNSIILYIENMKKLFRESSQKAGFKPKASTFGENILILIERKWM